VDEPRQSHDAVLDGHADIGCIEIRIPQKLTLYVTFDLCNGRRSL
jgi:hypothetical protein